MTLTPPPAPDDQALFTAAARLAAQRSPGRMAVVCGRDTFQYRRVHQLMDEAIVRAVAKPEGRLILSVTVRAGKSTIGSRWLPAWYLGRRPDHRVMVACHEVGLAAEHTGAARDILAEFGPPVFDVAVSPGSSSRSRWDIAGRAGGALALGVGGSPIGRGADLLVIDDPTKSWEVAQNPDARRKINEIWWQGTMASRIEPGGTVIVICSRWHEDDLPGFLLREYGGEWDELRVPALCDDPESDPLDRELGESFWEERWPASLLLRRKHGTLPRVWLGQYQQRPTAEDGEQFPAKNLYDHIVEPKHLDNADIEWCRGWDLAATEGAGDYTVGFKIGRYLSTGRWIIGDVVRGQWGENNVKKQILKTARLDGFDVKIELPQDPGQAGKSQVAQLAADLSGYLVESRPQTGSKEVRAGGFAAQVQAGNVDMLRAPWNRELVEELDVFPNGEHDDQADAGSSAFNRIAEVPIADAGAGSGEAFGGAQRTQ